MGIAIYKKNGADIRKKNGYRQIQKYTYVKCDEADSRSESESLYSKLQHGHVV